MVLDRMTKAKEGKILHIMFGKEAGSVRKEVCKLTAWSGSILSPGKEGRVQEKRLGLGREAEMIHCDSTCTKGLRVTGSLSGICEGAVLHKAFFFFFFCMSSGWDHLHNSMSKRDSICICIDEYLYLYLDICTHTVCNKKFNRVFWKLLTWRVDIFLSYPIQQTTGQAQVSTRK